MTPERRSPSPSCRGWRRKWRTFSDWAASTVGPHAAKGVWRKPAIPSILTVLVLLWMLAFGVAAAWTAAQLGRARPLWFAFGAILGPVALVLLRAAPPALCGTCGSPTRGWLKVCWWCRQSVFGPPTETERPVRVAGEVPVNQASPHPELARPSNLQRSLRDRLETPPDRSPAPAAGSIRTRRSPRSTGAAIDTMPKPAVSPPIASHSGPDEPPTVTRAPADAGGEPAATPAAAGSAGDATGTLATAVYVAGSTNLQSGHRYGIAIRESRLQILGPTEVQPERVALDRPLAGLEARSVEGRLILADTNGFVLAFMAVAGPSTRALAAKIADAARGGGQP